MGYQSAVPDYTDALIANYTVQPGNT